MLNFIGAIRIAQSQYQFTRQILWR